MEQKEPRINNGYAGLVITTAGLFDLVSIIPIVNIIIVPVAWLTLFVMFRIKDVSIGFGSPKRLLTTSLGGLIDAIPAISVLPAWVAVAIINVGLSRLEDRGLAPLAAITKQKPSAPRGTSRSIRRLMETERLTTPTGETIGIRGTPIEPQ